MKWFGDSWGAPVCDPEHQTETPVGEVCTLCGEPVTAGDQGLMVPHVPGGILPQHIDCFLAQVLGPHTQEQCR